ncbi:MAG: serine/threonine protein kinase [Candidatus Margulisbacteria bacterium]|nr:serine/threonine protein kinase [Candidatus Margulisiibacteriota bacterium]MBU1022521.1 serine/threonine protein kinase [Candidatus Margulisiibacteriota bacterium]MBU1728505.1 serine/threonine protein kinase [Candidatus Margulisiibacteriota bacterium]MBU1954652.1 serine/threonine protein kinase [Candidatus Margulisiibacteriota bacterium]
MTQPSIWQPLNHDTILHSVEKTLGKKLSNLLRHRNSYINRVYELEIHDSRERIIVKFYRPGRWTKEMILEEHQFLKELAAKEVLVIPPLEIKGQTLFEFESIPFALFPKKGGRALDEFGKDSWEELGRLLARIHMVGAIHQSSHRITWRPAVATQHHLEVLLKNDYLLPDFKKSFQHITEMFIKKADPFFSHHEFIQLHGDCHKGNLIHRPGEGIYIIDFDDMCLGPPVQDLWMLLPDIPENCENELSWFFKGYEVFRPFDRRTLKLIPLLRGMRIIHFAAWLAIQSKEAGFAKHFPEVGTARYWNELIKDLQEITYSIAD